jgi:hypothetical protein
MINLSGVSVGVCMLHKILIAFLGLIRLFNYGIGIHLLQSDDPESMTKNNLHINPKDNHISFQVSILILTLKA